MEEQKGKASHESEGFYRKTIGILNEAAVDFMVGGTFAHRCFTGVKRDTGDFDLMIRPGDANRALKVLEEHGYRSAKPFPHWLCKVFYQAWSIDLIYRSGNGISEVDDVWFRRAVDGEVLGQPVKLCPVEESLWVKSYIMERERYDGGDVAHLILCWGDKMDWRHLAGLFGPDWRVLLSHLILFGFVYPSERNKVPPQVMAYLTRKLRDEEEQEPQRERICRGTLLSRAQYLSDIERLGFRDARTDERVHMTPEDIQIWTEAIEQNRTS